MIQHLLISDNTLFSSRNLFSPQTRTRKPSLGTSSPFEWLYVWLHMQKKGMALRMALWSGFTEWHHEWHYGWLYGMALLAVQCCIAVCHGNNPTKSWKLPRSLGCIFGTLGMIRQFNVFIISSVGGGGIGPPNLGLICFSIS